MNTYEISKSSLLSLKVEILKKQEEIKKSKLENKSFVPSNSGHGKKSLKTTKNKGVDGRSEKDYEEDPDLLRKSRQMLEVKSKLYDKLSTKQSTFEDNKHYLVNFNQKSSKMSKNLEDCPNFDDDPDDYDKYQRNIDEDSDINEVYEDDNVDSDNEWTEYTDSLGRTRTCLKKDLEYMKNKDEKLTGQSRNLENEQPVERIQANNSDNRNETDKRYEDFNEKSELLSIDMKRELLRQQWEREEATLAQKDNLHYQDVLFNEARTHGVGYFAFSKDETERAKQQAELEKLRKETTQKQKEAQDLKKTREKILKNRIRAAQNRKRVRLGLPSLNESDDDQEKLEDVVKPIEEKEVTEEEKEKELYRQQHIRPWDIGKEGVETPKEHYIYSQEEWVAKKREERLQEFAPPEIDALDIRKDNEKRRNRHDFNTSSSKKVRKESYESVNPYKSQKELRMSESSDDSSSKDEDEDRLMQGFRKSRIIKNKVVPDKISFKVIKKTQSKDLDTTRISSNTTNSTSFIPDTSNNQQLPTANTSFTPVPIVNELLYSPTQSSNDSSSDDNDDEYGSASDRLLQDSQNVKTHSMSSRSTGQRQNLYAEIAPPATFDHYGPRGSNNSRTKKTNKGDNNMADSIIMGLKYLREQAEKKGKLNRGNDEF